MKSIMQKDTNYCYVCGCFGTEKHHAIKGTNRKHSDKYGLIVGLCYNHHRGTDGVHGKNGHELDVKLQQEAQKSFENRHGTRQDFMKIFGKSYL